MGLKSGGLGGVGIGVSLGGSGYSPSSGPSTPVNSVAPVVSGNGAEDTINLNTLTTTNGTWSGSPTFTYQWQSNDGSGWVDVATATDNTYVIGTIQEDGGLSIRCVVTATNGSGSVSANSNSLGPIVGTTGDQLISGAAFPGYTLSITNGTWTGSPTFTYQWKHQVGSDFIDIPGATSSTYLLDDTYATGDIYVGCSVIGTNAVGVLPAPVLTLQSLKVYPTPSNPFIEDGPDADYIYAPVATAITVETWGAGQTGINSTSATTRGGVGGISGGYSKSVITPSAIGQFIYYQSGDGASSTGTAKDSWATFAPSIFTGNNPPADSAHGCLGKGGGSPTTAIGTTINAGAAGGTCTGTQVHGGGGASSGGTTLPGIAGGNSLGATGGAGGAGVLGGGAGGNGGADANDGVAGSTPGGGGGGPGRGVGKVGGTGGAGRVKISW